METGAHVWLKSDTSQWGWVPAYIANKEPLDKEGNTVQLTLKDDRQSSVRTGRSARYHKEEIEPFEIKVDVDSEQLRRPEGLENVKLRNIDTSNSNTSISESENASSNVNNLIHLTHLHEPAILHSLRIRYDQDLIYTNTGPILIAVNPFKPMEELYSIDCMDRYRMAGEEDSDASAKSSTRGEPLSPHVYKTTDDAYRAMVRGVETPSGRVKGGNPPRNQSILVSGESGAGKTVTTKIVLNYLAMLSKRTEELLGSDKDKKDDIVTIEQQVLQSNPILEAFGNARTIRNDNSSRFGKYIDVHFTANGKLTGATIETYLLEKVRLIQPTFGERNYHVFYQLLASASEEERAQFFLKNLQPCDFMILQSSDTYDRRDGISDKKNHLEMLSALATIGFEADVIKSLMQLVVSVLFLGNLKFVENHQSDHEDDGCLLLESEDLDAASQLLGVDRDKLAQSLTTKIVVSRLESVTVSLSVSQATNAKDALIKAIYGSMFDFVVQQTNKSIKDETSRGASSRRSGSPAACIGVLDIYGFENFEVNTFEQICINYINEALQQQFNKYVFKMEQQESNLEGTVSFSDNQDVLDLIDKKHVGILALLDEQCIVPQSSDEKFTRYLYSKCVKHPRFSASSSQRVSNKFAVEHYAGPVEYSTEGWLEKNRDQLPDASVRLLTESTIPLVHTIRPFIRVEQKKQKGAESDGYGGPMGGSISAKSVGAQFTTQLRELRKRIDATVPHYIRCLKPNDKLVPYCFEPKNVVEQLRCGGVLEAVRVSRAWYPSLYPQEDCSKRALVVDNGGLSSPFEVDLTSLQIDFFEL